MSAETLVQATPIQQEDHQPLWKDLFETNGWTIFLFTIAVSAILQFFSSKFILTDELFYNSLGEQMTMERIEDFLAIQKERVWLQYGIIPLVLLIQTTFIAVCLNTGSFLKQAKLGFRDLFRITLIASLVFLIAKVIITLILMFSDVSVLDDMAKADFFSLSALIGQDNVPEWLKMAAGSANIFQVLFILVLSLGIRSLDISKIKKPLAFVLKTYGAGLLLWVVFITFMILNLTT